MGIARPLVGAYFAAFGIAFVLAFTSSDEFVATRVFVTGAAFAIGAAAQPFIEWTISSASTEKVAKPTASA
jgi:hypothetical protein